MDTLITIVQEDYGYDLSFTLKDSTGAVVDLTSATLAFICQSVSDNSVNFNNAMSVVSAPDGTCTYTVQQTDFLTSGTFTAQIAVNYGVGTEIISFSGINIEVVPKLPVS